MPNPNLNSLNRPGSYTVSMLTNFINVAMAAKKQAIQSEYINLMLNLNSKGLGTALVSISKVPSRPMN